MAKFIKHFFIFLLLTTGIISLGLFSSFTLLKHKPHSIPFISSLISYKIRLLIPQAIVEVTNNSVSLNENNEILLKLNDITINANNSYLKNAKIEELQISFDLNRFYQVKNLIKSIYVKNPQIQLEYTQPAPGPSHQAQRQITNFTKEYKNTISTILATEINVDKGEVSMETHGQHYRWKINRFIGKTQNTQYLMELDTKLDDKPTSLKFIATKISKKKFDVAMHFRNIPIIAITNYLENYKIPFVTFFNSSNNLVFASGATGFTIYNDGTIHEADLSIGMASTISPDHEHSSLLEVSSLQADIAVRENVKDVQINNFNINFINGAKISSELHIKRKNNFINAFNNDLTDFILHYNVKDIPITHINLLWPEYYESNVRTWIIDNIADGKITSGSGKFKFNENFFKTKKLEKDDIDANINVENTSLIYYKELPKITNIKGVIKFDGAVLNALIDSGIIKNSKLKASNVELPYNLDQVVLKGFITGPVSDYESFIPVDNVAQLENLKVDLKQIQNIASSNIDLTIPLTQNLKTNNILITIESKIDHIVLSKKLSNFPVDNAKLTVKSDGKTFTILADGKCKKSAINILFSNSFNNVAIDNKFLVKAQLTNESIEAIGLQHDIHLLKNTTIPLTIDIVDDKMNVDSDLTKTELKVLKLGFIKTQNVPLKFNFVSTIKDNKITNITNISAKGNNISLDGEASFDENSELLKEVNLKIDKLGINKNIIVNYHNNNKQKQLNINANLMDLVYADFHNIFSAKNLEPEGKIINIKANKILMKNSEILEKVNFQYNCAANFTCNEIKLNSIIDNNSFIKVNLIKENNQEIIKINSNNGSAFLQAFGVYKNIKKGDLEIIATKNIKKANNGRKFLALDGNIKMTDFAITEQSFITKLILNLTSVPGIFNMLEGSSIKMKEYNSTLNYNDGILKIDGKMSGPSLEITMNGTVDTNNDEIKIKGSIIPSIYGINTVLSELPLIGKVVSGGSDAAIAASYNVQGTIENSEIRINPLSLLPLSVFKKIFE